MSRDDCKKNGPVCWERSRPITTTDGDAVFDRLMGERRYEDARVGKMGGHMPRPDPVPIVGGGSSLTSIGGGNHGHKRGTTNR
jgi:hypothetical protein